MTTYAILDHSGKELTRVQADYHRYTADDDRTRLYRSRRFLWDKCVYTTKRSETVVSVSGRKS